MTVLSPVRRASAWCVRLPAAFAWLGSVAMVHLPGPSGFQAPETQARVRSAWTSAGDLASRAASPFEGLVPDILDPLFDDKTIHFGVFFVVALLLFAERVLARRATPRWMGGLAIGLAAQAILGELLQSATGRVGEVGDVLANLLGVVVALGAVVSLRYAVRGARGRASAVRLSRAPRPT